ncbi:hypothetical protein GC175_18550 [bacterium]|nr:hypothetical protein [bacterium]
MSLLESVRERIYRRNFFFMTTDGILFMVAMGMIGSTTVIPDFVRRLTDSEILIGLSGSLFEIGWTLPQLFIARYMLRFERKKWWFIGPSIPVRFVMLIFAGLIVWFGKEQPGAILVAFFICWGIAAVGDGVVGVPWADISGTSLDSKWRARMFGVHTGAAGLIMLGVAPVIAWILANRTFPDNYAIVFGMSGVLFAVSIIPILFIHELPGAKKVDKLPSFAEFLPELGHVLRTDGPYRSLIITRMFTTLFAMSSPFYIGYATVTLGMSSAVAVPTLLLMQTIGSVTGSLLYTWIGARNNLLFIRLALIGAALWPVSALLAGVVGPWTLYVGFLVAGVAISNLGFSYQNWVVTYADADRRPVYVGLFNTVSAVVSMAAPFIGGTIAQRAGYPPLFMVSLVMALGALFMATRFVRTMHRVEMVPSA